MGKVIPVVPKSPPAYIGAKFDIQGFCIFHPNVRLCTPIPPPAKKHGHSDPSLTDATTDDDDDDDNSHSNIQFKIVRKTCHKCGERGVQNNRKLMQRRASHGYNPDKINGSIDEQMKNNAKEARLRLRDFRHSASGDHAQTLHSSRSDSRPKSRGKQRRKSTSDKHDKTEKSEKHDKSEKSEKHDKSEKSGKHEKTEKSEKHLKSDKQDKTDKSDEPEKSKSRVATLVKHKEKDLRRVRRKATLALADNVARHVDQVTKLSSRALSNHAEHPDKVASSGRAVVTRSKDRRKDYSKQHSKEHKHFTTKSSKDSILLRKSSKGLPDPKPDIRNDLPRLANGDDFGQQTKIQIEYYSGSTKLPTTLCTERKQGGDARRKALVTTRRHSWKDSKDFIKDEKKSSPLKKLPSLGSHKIKALEKKKSGALANAAAVTSSAQEEAEEEKHKLVAGIKKPNRKHPFKGKFCWTYV